MVVNPDGGDVELSSPQTRVMADSLGGPPNIINDDVLTQRKVCANRGRASAVIFSRYFGAKTVKICILS